MSQHRVSRLLPYTCQQLYTLVLDIERYPEFVPGYRQARIVRHEVNVLEVEQAVGFGPLGFRFRSRATYTVPSYIEVLASDGPFRRLEVRWEFVAEGAGCRVTATTLYQASGLLAPLLDGWVGRVAPQLLHIFARRAQLLYGASD